MFRVGDRVVPFNRISYVGTVVELITYKPKTWLAGGTSGEGFKIRVQHDKDQQVVEYILNELMRFE